MCGCSGGILLPSTLPQTNTLYYSEQKKTTLISASIFYCYLQVWRGKKERKKQTKKPLSKLLREQGNASKSLSALFQAYRCLKYKNVRVHPQTQAASCSGSTL